MSPFRIVLAAAAVVLAASIGYAAWSAHEKRAEQAAIAAAVEQGAAALAAQLRADPAPANAAAARAAAGSLASARTSRQREMARAADEYLAAAAAIAERRMDAARLAREAAAGRDAVAAHFSATDRRGAAWIHRAVELKRQAERQEADLGRTLTAIADNLDSLDAPEGILARHMDPARLVPKDLRTAASARARADAKGAADALERLGRLAER
jgi:hypothetical protein